jgi:hypothetical protein
MKKLIVVPVVAVIAAVGAASAAGFAGGVSSGALQTGQTSDLECAKSARIIEYGFNDHLATPNVVNVRVELKGADCVGQSVTVLPIGPDGAQNSNARFVGRVPAQGKGTQTVRITSETPADAEQLKAVRISIDPGYTGEGDGTVG